jgi:RimJ/RimL family protein N-acetyltransferase
MIVQHHVEHRASAKVLKHLGFQEIRGADGHAEKDVCQYQRIALLK